MKRCEECGKRFTAQRSTARFCSSSCRGKASARRKIVAAVTVLPQNPEKSSVDPSGHQGLVQAVREQLERAEKANSYAGEQVLFMAGRLERSAGDTGSAVAALSRELDRLMVALMADVTHEPDELDLIQGKVLQMRTRRRA